VELEIFMLCEINLSQKKKYTIFFSHLNNLDLKKKTCKYKGDYLGRGRRPATGEREEKEL
jgi:hypothetical protein